ncbi:hypothetical protein [Methylocystis echinoides]|uniref:Uncharacterized protein n=1 Tax=Methylocystis echinoides TaxID=29468 RepID=A0A9W6GQ49_9HYPH|nr:hypothetical protein [Methylocystis echinoides]GLI91122.1 hypothetical protein LMG27198_01140 [Methylocystis echinoides]
MDLDQLAGFSIEDSDAATRAYIDASRRENIPFKDFWLRVRNQRLLKLQRLDLAALSN